MNQKDKYDAEDIESLLLHKRFEDLYPEEKEFVLRHIETPDEYESLRHTLFELHKASKDESWIEPDVRLKEDLLAQFPTEESGGFKIWLNTLFFSQSGSWYRRPAYLSIVAMVFIGVTLLFFMNPNDSTKTEFAETKTTEVAHPSDSAVAAASQEKAEDILNQPTVMPDSAEEYNAEQIIELNRTSVQSAIVQRKKSALLSQQESPAMVQLDTADIAPSVDSDMGEKEAIIAEDAAVSEFTQVHEKVSSKTQVMPSRFAEKSNDEISSDSRQLKDVEGLLSILFTAQ